MQGGAQRCLCCNSRAVLLRTHTAGHGSPQLGAGTGRGWPTTSHLPRPSVHRQLGTGWVQAGYRLASLQGAWKSPQGSLQQHMSVCTAESARSLYEPRAIGAIPINTELLVPPACCEPRRPSLGFTSPPPLPTHSTCLVAPGPPPPGHTTLSGHSAHVSPVGRGAELSPQPHAVSRHIPATPPARRCAPCSQGTAAELTPAPEGSAGRKAAA